MAWTKQRAGRLNRGGRAMFWTSLVVLFVLTMPRSAQAQGAFGLLPSPITTKELMSYGDRLDLSDQQRQAALGFHDLYKREYRILRDTEIAAFIESMNSMQGTIPSREQFEKFITDMDRLMLKIGSVDGRLIDQMQTILSDEQGAMLSRVRLARERKRLGGSMLQFASGGRAPVDLSEIFAKLDLSPDELSAADPVIQQYESRLTAGVRKLRASTTSLFRGMFDALEAMGVDQDSMEELQSNPEKAMELARAMQETMMQLMQENRIAADKIKEMNLRTYRTVTSLLDERSARRLQRDFFNAAYPQASFALVDAQRWVDAARNVGELRDQDREAVGDFATALQSSLDSVLERAVGAINEFEASGALMSMDMSSRSDFDKLMREMREEATRVRTQAKEQLAGAIGADLMADLERKIVQGETDESEQAATVVTTEVEPRAWRGDRFVPRQIATDEVRRYGGRLDLDDDDRAVLQALHDDYRAAYAIVRDAELQAVQDANAELWQVDPGVGETRVPSDADLARLSRLRTAALHAIQRTDDEFFDNVGLLLTTDDQRMQLESVRLSRRRAGYGLGGANNYQPFATGSSELIELDELVRLQGWPETAERTAFEQLRSSERELTEAYRVRYERALAYQEAMDQWSAEIYRAQNEEGSDSVALSMRYRELLGPVTAQLNESNVAIAALNVSALQRLVEALDDEHAAAIRRAFDRKTHPSVYNDPASVEEHVSRALGLDDLSADQRTRLAQLAAEYRPAYVELCDQMVALLVDVEPYAFNDDEYDWQAYARREAALAELRFDRRELSDRASNRLRMILTEGQIGRIGGLPDPPDEENPWDG